MSHAKLIARLRYMSFETWDDQPNECEAIVQRAADEIERLRVALEGVIRIADRDCPEFRAARAALAKKGGEQ